MANSKYLSVIVPLYNEEDNVCMLHEQIQGVLLTLNVAYEVLYVDDGSTDQTYARLLPLASGDPCVQIIRLNRNFGQTAAIAAGIAHSSGEVLICLDGDLQNDPRDIPLLLARLDEGYDVVSGWRKQRKDAQLSRKLPSLLANKLISKVTGVELHDYGCTLKAYRRHVFEHIHLYGEMHRFIPAYAALTGARIAEIEVRHHPRNAGTSKYGISRTVRVILDLMTLKFLGNSRPGHALGLPGLCALLFGGLIALYLLMHKLLMPGSRYRHSLFMASLGLLCFGVNAIMQGWLAELLLRTYHEAQGKTTYVVKDIVKAKSPPNVLHETDGDAILAKLRKRLANGSE